MTEIRVKPLRKLPEPLPAGERVLWQQSPLWRPFSRRVFQLDKIGFYFLVVVGWVAVSAYLSTGEFLGVLRSLSWSVPPALGVLGLLAVISWFYARTTTYTITSERVIVQSGLAVPAAVNLPFSKISSADMKTFAGGTGDIELTMSGQRLLYSMLWPNARFFRLKWPTPVIRAVQQPEKVAVILGQALADYHQTEATSGQEEAIAERGGKAQQPSARQAVSAG